MRPAPALRLTASRGGTPLGLILALVGAATKALTLVLAAAGYRASLCFFKLTTGCPCMTCGTTRAANRLLALDVGGAFAMNPLATTAMLLLVPWAIADVFLVLRGRALSVDVSDGLAALLRPLVLIAAFVNWGYLVAAGR